MIACAQLLWGAEILYLKQRWNQKTWCLSKQNDKNMMHVLQHQQEAVNSTTSSSSQRSAGDCFWDRDIDLKYNHLWLSPSSCKPCSALPLTQDDQQLANQERLEPPKRAVCLLGKIQVTPVLLPDRKNISQHELYFNPQNYRDLFPKIYKGCIPCSKKHHWRHEKQR